MVIFKARPPGSILSVIRVARLFFLMVSGIDLPSTAIARSSWIGGPLSGVSFFGRGNMRVF